MLSKLVSGFMGQLKSSHVVGHATTELSLPPPELEARQPLMRALSQRRSERKFQRTPLSLQVISNLLWVAFGVNRPETGDRTAPSALDAQEIDVYAALEGGLYVYSAKNHALRLIANVDARRVTGYQDFVDEAPLDLIYVWNRRGTPIHVGDRGATYAAIATGAIMQNVYLYCASAGLATVARAFFNHEALAAELRLGKDEHVLLTQTIGYPG